MSQPTIEKYDELQKAYDFFNLELFDGELKNCLITLQRSHIFAGYFARDRWRNRVGEIVDEIAINPVFINESNIDEIFQTLVHEMAHLWQKHYGSPGRGGYHNREWADKMESIGLMPSSTGLPGGRRTGDHMSDYIIESGRLSSSILKLKQSDFALTWIDRFSLIHSGNAVESDESENGIDKRKTYREKYHCQICGINTWGKANLHLICGTCDKRLVIVRKEKKT